MGRPHKYSTPDALSAAWQLYKDYCDNQVVGIQKFNLLNGEFTSGEISRCITYTIKGFCAWAGLSRSSFYANYAKNAQFADTVTRVREECEVDVRTKFELGLIPTRLAPLWMGSFKCDYIPKESVIVR